MSTQNTKLDVKQLGLVNYKESYNLQKKLQEQRIKEEIGDTLLLLEHPYVITLGTRGVQADILAASSVLQQNKVQIEKIERGGQATLHAPGQLVGYFIFHLYKKKLALREFIADIEKILVTSLTSLNINAQAGKDERGVWVDNAKIASIGISINKGVSMHGFALNVCNNLEAFNWIVPCGMPGRLMTNVKNECIKNKTQAPTVDEIATLIINNTIAIRGYHT